MRILLVTPMPPQQEAPGAIPLVLHAQLLGLRERHDVTLVTVAGQEPGEQAAVEELAGSGVKIHAVRRQTPFGLERWKRRLRMASAWLLRGYPWRTVWFWEPEIQIILDRLLASNPYDLVLVEDNAMGIYRYNTTTPRVMTEHEVRRPRAFDWRFWKHSNPASWLLGEIDWRRWVAYEREVWSQFDCLQVFTQKDAQSIGEIAPQLAGKVITNPFGVEIPELLDPGLQDSKTILFVGNFTHPPNVDAALWLGREIMPLLRERCPGLKLSLVGIYPPKEVAALAGDDIEVLGPVDEIEPYLEKAALVLAPVRIGGGMRMKVLKAMASGKAVVTTPRGSEGLEIGGEKPPVGVAGDTEGFAALTHSLLISPQERAEMGRRARAYVQEHFSPQAYARRIEAMHAQIQRGRG